MHNKTPDLCGKPKKGKTIVRIRSQYKLITTPNIIGLLTKGTLPNRKKGSLPKTHSWIRKKKK
jgi:hypothetical protein